MYKGVATAKTDDKKDKQIKVVLRSSYGLKLFKTEYIAFSKSLYCKNMQQVYFHVRNKPITYYINRYCWISTTLERQKSV